MIAEHEWETLTYLIEEAWPGEFDDNAANAWRMLLDGYDAEQVLVAVRSLLARGGRFRPAVSEVIAELRADPARPTFAEAYTLIYGRGGVLKAREPYSGPVRDPEESKQRAMQARIGELHPLVGAFIRAYGLERLRLLEVDDPQYGDLKRKELGREWDRFLEANEGRDVAALAAGRRGEIGKFDPLRTLGAGSANDLVKEHG